MNRNIFVIIFLFFMVNAVNASMTKFFIEQGIGNFESGEFDRVAIDNNGFLTLAPKLNILFKKEDIISVWSVAEDSNGDLYFGTGNRARIYKYEGSNNFLIKEFDEGLSVNSIIIDSNDNIYVAVNPSGYIYKIIRKDNEIENEVVKISIDSKYVWEMVKDSSDNIYIAAGNPAKIYKLNNKGMLREYYSSKTESHFLSLAIRKNRLYFASEGNGLLYESDLKSNKTKVLFDSPENEIKDIAVDDKGVIYFATASKIAKQLTKVFNYTDSFILYGSKENDRQEIKANKNIKKTILKNSIYKIERNREVKKLFTKDNSLFLALAVDKNNNLYAGTNDNGIIYKIRGINDAVIFSDTSEENILSLFVNSDNNLIATTSGIGKALKIGLNDLTHGVYKSQILDAESSANWGTLNWDSEDSKNKNLTFFIRQGNTNKPDNTWSNWIEHKGNLEKDNIKSSNLNINASQFIQYKVNFHSKIRGESPLLKRVFISYLNENRSPNIEKITLKYKTDKKALRSSPFDSIIKPKYYELNWLSSDPDYDILTHKIYFKNIKQKRWYLLNKNISKNEYIFDSQRIPDGQYKFKIITSDIKSNSSLVYKEAQSVSKIFRIDNTPPEIEDIKIIKDKNSLTIKGKVKDNFSFIKLIQYSINSNEWVYITPNDFIYDSFEEEFSFKIKDDGQTNKKLFQVENNIIIRVIDSYNNFTSKNIIF